MVNDPGAPTRGKPDEGTRRRGEAAIVRVEVGKVAMEAVDRGGGEAELAGCAEEAGMYE